MATKKRYHQTSKDKRHESHGMRHAEHLGGDFYAGVRSKRAMEERDSMMISEDKHAIANLPQHVVYKSWPKARHYVDYGLDDTIRGIDHQEDMDNARMEKHLQPEKY